MSTTSGKPPTEPSTSERASQRISFHETPTSPALQFKSILSSPTTNINPIEEPIEIITSDVDEADVPDSPGYQLPDTPEGDSRRLEDMCQALFEQDPGLLVLDIPEPLSGVLDFHFLGNRAIRDIRLAEHGHVFGIRGLPPTLQKFTCIHNELQELSSVLPASLLELNVSHNYLSTLDFSQTPQLRVFRGEHNRLYALDDLPSTLEELYVSYNRLSEIHLHGLTRLRVLHCEHNQHPLILKHVPSQPMEIRMDDGPLNQIRPETGATEEDDDDESASGTTAPTTTKKKTSKIHYTQALNQYMMYKSKYENGAKAWRAIQRDATKKKPTKKAQVAVGIAYPPCVQCAANVGMTFTHKDGHYHASCGATPSNKNCDFTIHLNAGYFLPFHAFLRDESAKMDQEKQVFMQQKMQTLFGYIQEKESTELFKTRLESYVESTQFYELLVNDYKSMYNNGSQQDLIHIQTKKIADTKAQIADLINEYRSDPTHPTLLHDAVEAQIQTLNPEIQQLRMLKHPVMEMIDKYNGDVTAECSRLFQSPFHLDRMAYQIHAPEVLEYRVASK